MLFACCPDFSDCPTPEAVKLKCRELDPESLNVGTGWRPERLDIDAGELAELPPLAAVNYSWHGFTCNKKGAEILSRSSVIVKPADARERELALPGLLAYFSQRSSPQSLKPELLKAETEKLLSSWHKKGLYGAEDLMCVLPERAVSLWPETFRRNIFYSETDADCSGGGSPLSPPKLKLFADGALSARTASVSEGYLQGERGVLIYADSELAQIFNSCQSRLRPAAVHAVGDEAIEQILRVYGQIAESAETAFPLRLEHCQFITEKQALRAKELRLTLCMQPNFSADSLTFADRLGHAALRRNNPLRMLIDKAGFIPGEDLLFGSDAMDCGAAAALQSALFPPYAGQRLSAEELKAGCRADARYGFTELLIDADNKSVIYA